MIIWLNGTFGAGKTTTSSHLMSLLPDARLFDPETVGYYLRQVINEEIDDFQNWPAWRALVAETIDQLFRHWGGRLVVPMTLLRQRYHQEIFSALAGRRLPVRHILLHADEDELVRRIELDTVEASARQWRLNHLEVYRDALPWLRESAEVFDTTRTPAAEVAAIIAKEV
ncbi:AAA family ATPase [Nonomuraea sp. SBT364]|uniref:AAA family ATPase n=1 Tax=Nonomuraea sp. SBT364 TaxID=1580530 RepID=UPI00066C5ED3|nr:AAA family ATPase [Nonomuraea sp. SBT364]